MPAIVCPICRRLTDSSAGRCFYCGARLGRALAMERWAGILLGRVDLTRVLLFMIAGLYIVHAFLSSTLSDPDRTGKGFISLARPAWSVLWASGIQSTSAVRGGEWWRLVTSIFVHLDLFHLLFNGLALYYVGFAVERIFGPARMLLLFVGSGLLGSLASLAFEIDGGGASGALFGLIGAMSYFGHRRGGTYGAEIKKQMLLWALYGFLLGFLVRANQVAHGGGFLGGIGLAALLGWERLRLVRTRNLLALAAALLVILAWILCFVHYRENLAYVRALERLLR